MATLNSTASRSHRKIALIIGNQHYIRSEDRLRHCINDADDLSNVLRNIKFQVKTAHDLTKSQMVSTISAFSETIVDGDLVMFYFSGHGYHINGRTYLAHVDDDLIKSDEDVEDYCTCVERTLHQLRQKSRSFVTVFILDCCRVHYPENKKQRKAKLEDISLHTIEVPHGSYVVFACSPNQIASDAKPNKDITQLFRTVANGVCIESKQKQKPIRMDGLMRLEHISLNEKPVTVHSASSTRPSSRIKISSTTTAKPAVIPPTTTTIKDQQTQNKMKKHSTC
ncbi:unnamed protein product [Rotaria magnacalcarata]